MNINLDANDDESQSFTEKNAKSKSKYFFHSSYVANLLLFRGRAGELIVTPNEKKAKQWNNSVVCESCAAKKCNYHDCDEQIGIIDGTFIILRKDISTLMMSSQFVKDEILDGYLRILGQNLGQKFPGSKILILHSHAMDTFTSSKAVEEWLIKMNFLTSFDKVLMPVNITNVHWVLMVIDLKVFEVRCRDSLHFEIPDIINTLFQILCQKNKENRWKLVKIQGGQKPGSNDCAPFVAKSAEEEINGDSSEYDAIRNTENIDMSEYRKKMFDVIIDKINSTTPQICSAKEKEEKLVILLKDVNMMGRKIKKFNMAVSTKHFDFEMPLSEGDCNTLFKVEYENISFCAILPDGNQNIRYFMIKLKQNKFFNANVIVFEFTLLTDGKFVLNSSEDDIKSFFPALDTNDPTRVLAICILRFTEKHVKIYEPFKKKTGGIMYCCKLNKETCSFYMMSRTGIVFFTQSCCVFLEYGAIKSISLDFVLGYKSFLDV
jgi:hypothetical protein